MDNDKTIVFREFATLGEASIVKGALETNGIPCFLSNTDNPYVGGILNDSFVNVRLNIFEKDKENAEELLQILQSSADSDFYEEEPSDPED
jgi:hypothetical protein